MASGFFVSIIEVVCQEGVGVGMLRVLTAAIGVKQFSNFPPFHPCYCSSCSDRYSSSSPAWNVAAAAAAIAVAL